MLRYHQQTAWNHRVGISRRAAQAIICLWLLGTLSIAATAGTDAAVLPLKVSSNGRYLVDQNNKPFLVVGDTAWSLIAQLTETDIDRYLADRRARGFNSVIVNLIEHKFCSSPPNTRSGLAPFSNTNDFSSPNRAYFNFAHGIIEKAGEYGLVVWLAPAYLGFGGGDEGFFREMKAGGRQKLHSYGVFLGREFKDLPNIVWLLGGDYTPPTSDRWTVTELAEAIHDQDTNHLMTVHAAPENSAASVFGDEKWLTVDTVYTYEQTLFRPVLNEFTRQPSRPFVLIESTYEGEHNSTPEQIRRQAYWAMLGGACGQFLGNNPIWHFDGPGLFPVELTWLKALDSVGSRDLARLRTLLLQFRWYELRPETNHLVISGGYGSGVETALTSLTDDHKLSLTYVPSTGTGARDLTVDASRFAGSLHSQWFNPVTGEMTRAEGLAATGEQLRRVRTPGDNGASANDWVLILQAQ